MRTMITILMIATVCISSQLKADGFDPRINDEASIFDIPFNTQHIYGEVMLERALAVNFEAAEEAYINDIPFDTQCVAKKAMADASAEQRFTTREEAYIDDIPFNTESIARENI